MAATLALVPTVWAARASVAASPSATDARGQEFVPGVVGALNALSKRPDALAIGRNGSRAGTTCKHYQGVARKNADDGTPYMFFTKSGNKSICVFQDDEPGWLFVARMGSRPTNGERMGTNVLPYGSTEYSALPGMPVLDEDKVVLKLPLDGTDLPAYRHPGGMQIVGDLLIIGAEEPFGDETSRATILQFDVHDPANPVYLGRFDPPDLGEDGIIDAQFGTDPVGLTQVTGPNGECCRYLMVAAGGPANTEVRFFQSRSSTVDGWVTDLAAGAPQWDEVGRYTEDEIEDCLGADWPTSGLIQGGQHQMLNFVREGGLDGDLYLLGGRRDGLIVNDFADEFLELYRVNLTAAGVPDSSCPFNFVSRKSMGEDAWGNEGDVSSFAAAGGTYISPTGELIVYSTKHDAEYLEFGGLLLRDHIPLGEYRGAGLVRANSPTLRPTASVDGPFTVDEGSSVALTGSGRHAITKAYVQVFEDDGVGLSLPGFFDDDEWLSVEYDQRRADDFDAFDKLGGDADEIWDNVGSVRWFAPVGCTISLNDFSRGSTSWPGEDTVLLRGTGRFEEIHDLDSLPTYRPPDEFWPVSPVPAGVEAEVIDVDDEIEGVTFYHDTKFNGEHAVRHDCESYYAAAVGLGWDLDHNGTFETPGTSVTFDAALLDGPSTQVVRAQAEHPTDTTIIGRGVPIDVAVEVRNVAPRIDTMVASDSLGVDVTDGVRVAIAGLPVRLDAAFTDPGRPDHQMAVVDWGDGTSSSVSDLDQFRDAFGGVVGHAQDTHVFAPGTFTVRVSVTDDDGGTGDRTISVEVVSIEDAIRSVADDLADMAATADTSLARLLLAARDELIGNQAGRSTNGAIDELDDDDPVSAITKLRAAIDFLRQAEAVSGSDLSGQWSLLGLAAESIATSARARAAAAIPNPSPGQGRALATILDFITSGHQQLLAGAPLSACDDFRQATSKALKLL